MSLVKHLLRHVFEDHRRRCYDWGGRGRTHGSSRPYEYPRPEALSMILGRFSSGGKKLLWALAGLTAFAILVFVILVAVLAPLITQALDYVSHNGLRGAVDTLAGLLTRIWQGSGK
jgi:hypothetical protein